MDKRWNSIYRHVDWNPHIYCGHTTDKIDALLYGMAALAKLKGGNNMEHELKEGTLVEMRNGKRGIIINRTIVDNMGIQ